MTRYVISVYWYKKVVGGIDFWREVRNASKQPISLDYLEALVHNVSCGANKHAFAKTTFEIIKFANNNCASP